MRLLVSLVFLNMLGCALDSAPELDTATQAIMQPETADPTLWDATKSGADDIWPGGQDIKTVTVTIKPDPNCGDASTVLADVVWDGDTLAARYRVRAGADEAAFQKAVAAAHASLTFAGVVPGGVTTNSGSAVGGPVPVPHPNV